MEQTEKLIFEGANAMLAPTWHFLRMNDTQIALPGDLEVVGCVEADIPATARGAEGAFDQALADMQQAWEETHPAPTAEERAERAAVLAAEADATYGGTAQSIYQARADALEEARSLAAAFELGVGEDIASYLRKCAGEHIVVEAATGTTCDCRIVVKGVPGAVSVAAVDVVAKKGSQVNVSLVVDGTGEGTAVGAGENVPAGIEPASAPTPAGIEPASVAGTIVRVIAEEAARVNIVRTQTLDDAFVDLDALGILASARARVDVRQTVLGAQKSFTGFGADLRGTQARTDVDTRYLGFGSQLRDFNYIVRHHGTKTISNLGANGVLAGKSEKTLRGTIDLVRGCKESEGAERESVLLVDEGVRNRTVPVILCNEDDVAGNHGATIGHIRAEQLFYLASRGLSPEVAERLFAEALIEQAYLEAPDAATQQAVLRLACNRGMDVELFAEEGE